MTARTILQSFDTYRIARMSFVHTVADLAMKPQNIEVLLGIGVIDLVQPLLNDVCPQIQQCAAIAVGRIAHHAGGEIREATLKSGLLTTLLHNLEKRNKYYRRAAMFVLRSICRHGEKTTEAAVVNTPGTLEAVMLCLVDIDPQVREAAAWAAGYIARSSPTLAKIVVEAGAVPQLVMCLEEPELSVRRVATSALADICRQSYELTVSVINANAVALLARAILDRDDILKRQALLALSSIASQDINASERIVQTEIFPDTYILMGHRCPHIRRNAAMLVRDIVRHTAELAQYIVNTGGVGALIEAIKNITSKKYAKSEDFRLPAVSALGHIATHGAPLAICIASCDGIAALKETLKTSFDNMELKSSCIWSLGQIGRYCPDQVAASGVLPQVMDTVGIIGLSEELKSRCLMTLRLCLQGCTSMPVLQSLLLQAKPDVLKYIIGQISKLLPGDPSARRQFVTSGCLKCVQEIEAEPGSPLMEYITSINQCFPEEIVRYYTPGYSDLLLKKVEEFQPTNESTFDIRPGPSRTVSRELAILFDD